MCNTVQILGRVPPVRQQFGYFCKIGNGIEVCWSLFETKRSIEVGADPCVPCVSSKLTDVIDMIDNLLESDIG